MQDNTKPYSETATIPNITTGTDQQECGTFVIRTGIMLVSKKKQMQKSTWS